MEIFQRVTECASQSKHLLGFFAFAEVIWRTSFLSNHYILLLLS